MTPEELQAIKDDLAVITPGPWRWGEGDLWTPVTDWDDVSNLVLITQEEYPFSYEYPPSLSGSSLPKVVLYADDDPPDNVADVAFIAKAPERISVLVVEVERLTAELAAVKRCMPRSAHEALKKAGKLREE